VLQGANQAGFSALPCPLSTMRASKPDIPESPKTCRSAPHFEFAVMRDTPQPTPSSARNFFKRIVPRWCLNRRSPMCASPRRDNDNILVMFRNVKPHFQIIGRQHRRAHLTPPRSSPRYSPSPSPARRCNHARAICLARSNWHRARPPRARRSVRHLGQSRGTGRRS
jgi:hypothetical protein